MANVYLIGAGPGDPGLLTIKGREILERADVVIYDYLANKVFLDFCRDDAQIIYVGKKGGDHTLPQDKINELIVQKAREGHVVARLKGGDPYVFGRGAEEGEELLDAGIDFEVVPGVTSAVAGPAYAGIPLTHRKYASSVSFITGHEDPTKGESAHNWESLAKGTSTLVFFMGVKNLPHITANLIQAGMDPDTPAALVRWGTTCRHFSMVSTVGNIAEDAVKQGIKPPSLLVVGHVVCLRDRLNFFEKRPLLGKGVVVTRARKQASGLVARLGELGACCYEFPTIRIKPLDDYGQVQEALAGLDTYDWILFTSVNGVVHFWDQLRQTGRDARALGGRKIAAIGPATARELEARGVFPDFVPEKYVAESVVQGLLKRGIQGKNVLVPRAKKAREVLPEGLRNAGCRVDVLPVYETVLAEDGQQEVLDGLASGDIHCLTFTSSSTVENFFALVEPDVVKSFVDKGLAIAVIGPVTAKTLATYGLAARIQPEEYTVPALAQAVAEVLGNHHA
ncbi:uroporphyrinogen-III C-methyltransferase [Desulfoplanes formicivorans]|uniref:uroporphyrinogen-III C-methyltransferase n=1 Tax=Desulfoplanes formicivorans TaxID=1592317 RepID=A0A194AHM9_9BACT|nr:uroporphyrinogen-III C-methyltransferase [Desulfoplanes formicivorans]GAU09587.1 HemD protein [Desulfoplanes formicivorans]